MSVMLKCYSVIIDCVTIEPRNGKEVVDGTNAIGRHYTYKLLSGPLLAAAASSTKANFPV